MSDALPICDLHCDLLLYLQHDSKRTANDLPARCALPQLDAGNVQTQVLALSTETCKGSVELVARQLAAYKQLPFRYPQQIQYAQTPQVAGCKKVLLAVENASGILEEGEKLQKAFERLAVFLLEGGPILYLSLTWNQENRWGGGSATNVGLKREGELLLEFLSETNIAIDLSHTSDALADDILNYIDKHRLRLIPIASHSNFRTICSVPRNLPDPIAKEIICRGGIIGLNFVRAFVGNTPADFLQQIEHGIKLGGENHLCFGADYFYEGDLTHSIAHLLPLYFPGFENASCYPKLVDLLRQQFSEKQCVGIAHQNFYNFCSKTSNACLSKRS